MLGSRRGLFVTVGMGIATVAVMELAVMIIDPEWAKPEPISSIAVSPSDMPSPVLPGDLVQTTTAQWRMFQTVEITQTAVALALIPTATVDPTGSMPPMFSPTHTPTVTVSPSATPTHIPRSTDVPSATPSPTPLPPTPTVMPTPPIAPPPIVSRAEWGAEPPTGSYRPHQPARIMLHHDGVVFENNAAERLRAIQRYAIHSHGWIDIPYHYLIDQEGNIYEGRPPGTIGDTATDYNPEGHVLITVLGDYNVQEVDARQLEAIITLATWLSVNYDIPPRNIAGHRDYAVTSCPGAHLYAYLSNGYISAMVAQRLGK